MRFCLCLFLVASFAAHAADLSKSTVLEGRLKVQQGKAPVVETKDHQSIILEGDETATKVLNDARLNGYEVQARGHMSGQYRFVVDPSHNHSLLVRDKGKLKLVSYWYDICSIRSFTPGPCVCCQRETALDLLDPDHVHDSDHE